MGNRTAKFISALFATVLAGAPLSAVSQNASDDPTAADDCLAKPKGTAPQGQHWYYRIERNTNRQCWYLREEGAKTARSPAQNTTETIQPTTSAQKPDWPAPRSTQSARAELTGPQAPPDPVQDVTATSPTPPAVITPPITNPGSNPSIGAAQQPMLEQRGPELSTAAAPAAQSAPVTKPADARPVAKPDIASSGGATTLAAADAPAEKPVASLQMLLLVIGGALALAGITASLIYRFAGSRVRGRARASGRRRVNWGNREHPADDSRAPWIDAAATVAPVQRPKRQDFSPPVARKADSATKAIKAVDLAARQREVATIQPDPTPTEFDLDREWSKPATRVEVADADAEHHDVDADPVDIDAITAMLERLIKDGPRLNEPTSGAGSASRERIQQDRPGVRA